MVMVMMLVLVRQACTCDDCNGGSEWLSRRASCGCRYGRSMSRTWGIWVVQRGRSKRLVKGERRGVRGVSL